MNVFPMYVFSALNIFLSTLQIFFY